MGEIYKTKQRGLILNYFLEHKEQHITADDILSYFRKVGTSVGKSTIYRYLDILVNQGIVRKYSIEEGESACYQYCEGCNTCCDNFHLKCSKCGQLIHIQSEALAKIDDDILENFNFKVDNSKTVFYGLCEACLNK